MGGQQETVSEALEGLVDDTQNGARALSMKPQWVENDTVLPCFMNFTGTDCLHDARNGTSSTWNMSFQMFGDGSSIGDSIFDVLYIRVIFIVLYGAVFACCSVGNLLVIIVVLGHRKMRTTTNFFLANLAVADLSVGIFCVLPNLGMYLSPYWFLGKVMCKLLYFVQMMAYAASITVLTVISIERYFAILHPLRSKQWKTLFLMRVIVFLIWLAAAVCGIPQLVFYNTVDLPSSEDVIVSFCITVVKHDRKAYVTINFVLWYLLPLSLMILMYSRISVVLWQTSRSDRSLASPAVWSWKAKRGRDQLNLNFQSHVTTSRPSTSDQSRATVGSLDEASSVCREYLPKQSDTELRRKQRRGRGPEGAVQLEASDGHDHHGRRPCHDKVPGHAGQDAMVEIDDRPSNSSRKSRTNDDGNKASDVIEMQNAGRAQAAGCLLNERNCGQETQLGSAVKKTANQKYVRFTCARWDKTENALIARRRVIRLLIAIIICFAICVMPYHIFMMWQTWRSSHHNQDNYAQMLAAPITFLIFYFNSALNPVLYAFLSENFRRSLRELVQGNKPTVVTKNIRRTASTSKTHNTSV